MGITRSKVTKLDVISDHLLFLLFESFSFYILIISFSFLSSHFLSMELHDFMCFSTHFTSFHTMSCHVPHLILLSCINSCIPACMHAVMHSCMQSFILACIHAVIMHSVSQPVSQSVSQWVSHWVIQVIDFCFFMSCDISTSICGFHCCISQAQSFIEQTFLHGQFLSLRCSHCSFPTLRPRRARAPLLVPGSYWCHVHIIIVCFKSHIPSYRNWFKYLCIPN